MQHISQSNNPLSVESKQKTQSGEQCENSERNIRSIEDIEYLWVRMTELYGHKWSSSHGVEDTNDTWRKVLSGFTRQQIVMGLVACVKRALAWPPSATEFRQMCSLNIVDLPDPNTAYVEACHAVGNLQQTQWSHPIVYRAGQATGWFLLGTGSQEQVGPVFKRNYEILLNRMANGEKLNLPVPEGIEQQASQSVLTDKERLQRQQEAMRFRQNVLDCSASIRVGFNQNLDDYSLHHPELREGEQFWCNVKVTQNEYKHFFRRRFLPSGQVRLGEKAYTKSGGLINDLLPVFALISSAVNAEFRQKA